MVFHVQVLLPVRSAGMFKFKGNAVFGISLLLLRKRRYLEAIASRSSANFVFTSCLQNKDLL